MGILPFHGEMTPMRFPPFGGAAAWLSQVDTHEKLAQLMWIRGFVIIKFIMDGINYNVDL